MVLEETRLTSLQMVSLSRMKSSFEAIQTYLRLDPTSGTTQIIFIQMMKNSNLIDHLPQVVLDRALTEEPPSLKGTKEMSRNDRQLYGEKCKALAPLRQD